MGEDERTLVLMAQAGDVEAFSRLVQLYWVRLVRFARSVAGDSDAEDLVQDGFVSAWEKLPGLQDPRAFSSWVMRIVSRKCFRRARRVRYLVSLDALSDPADPAGSDSVESVEVERVLAILPARQRAVMHLTVIEGMSDTEIGAVLHIAAASVRSHRRRARDTLSSVLRAAGPRGGTAS
jgi:RNA polymerase sigma-70 factor (ECF subfamily)